MGQLAEAERHHRIALEQPAEVGNAHLRAEILNELGTTLHAAGDPGAAGCHAEALELATSSGFVYFQGRALAGLADSVRDEQPHLARRYLEHALAVFTKMDIPARHDIARQLDELRERPLATAS